MCCKLWDYCLHVISSLMWPTKLVQYIECRGDGYFPQIFPLFFTYMSLMSSMVPYFLVQVTS